MQERTPGVRGQMAELCPFREGCVHPSGWPGARGGHTHSPDEGNGQVRAQGCGGGLLGASGFSVRLTAWPRGEREAWEPASGVRTEEEVTRESRRA